MARQVPGVLGQFEHIDAACDLIRELKASGHRDLTVYTPAANHQVEAAIGDPVSPVRWYTLIGGLIGCASGFGVTIWMSRDWPLITGGKPVAAIPAYVAIGFELTILLGSLATIVGIIVLCMSKSLKGRPYSPRFSDDRIGIFVPSQADDAQRVETMMTEYGAVEVSRDA